jgi:hypothetical protein
MTIERSLLCVVARVSWLGLLFVAYLDVLGQPPDALAIAY